MDSESLIPSGDEVRCSNCGCTCGLESGSPSSWIRSVKRKHEVSEVANQLHVPGLELDVNSNARIQIENECDLLRETVSNQQQTIQDLYEELDEERNASMTAADEAMSMILRLQREKAEIQMEARQFKRFAEEKMAHDQQELSAAEDLLYKREQAIQSLTCEVQAYKHRMLSYGLTEAETEGKKSGISRSPSMVVDIDTQFDFPAYDYPPLKCNINDNLDQLEADFDVEDVENYPTVGSPYGQEPLKSLEHRISQMERIPSYTRPDEDSSGGRNVLEKVVVGHSPRRRRHFKSLSIDSSSSPLGTAKEIRPDFFTDSQRYNSGSYKKMVDVSQAEDRSNGKNKDEASEVGDDMSDRVYTIDSVHKEVSHSGVAEGKSGRDISGQYAPSPSELLNQPDVAEPDIKKLHMRLQALEADRESMRHTILSMRTDKAQLILLKEIAQQLSKEAHPERRMPVSKTSNARGFFFVPIFKWIFSFILWKKKARQSKYMHGIPANNMGLLMVLDKVPRRQWRCLTSIQV